MIIGVCVREKGIKRMSLNIDRGVRKFYAMFPLFRVLGCCKENKVLKNGRNFWSGTEEFEDYDRIIAT